MTVAVTLCERDPVVPVTVTVNVPVTEDVQERLETPELVWLFGLTLQTSPPEGETEYDRSTLPMKPFTPATLIMEEPVLPTFIDKLDGLMARVKSVMWTVTATVPTEGEPVVAVTVTV